MTTFTYTTINPPGSTYATAYGINNRGQTPGSVQTIAYGINDSGQIIGWYSSSSATHQLGFLDSGGV
jgi:hypothetical protein